MKTYAQILAESKKAEILSSPDAFMKWIDQFPKSGKAPRGMKKEFEHIKFLLHQSDSMKKYGFTAMDNVSAVLSYYTDAEIKALEDKFLSTSKTERVESGNFTFINESSMAEKSFLSKVKGIEKLLQSLKGFHKKAVNEPLTIAFKATNVFKARALYKASEDQIWVKQSAKVDNELYGHLLYIIVHELGHRYERKYGHPKGWKQTITTKYSRTDSFAGDESFAELFALSHWEKSYPEYSEQITWFKGLF